jgi:ubiquinone biosynthesis protein
MSVRDQLKYDDLVSDAYRALIDTKSFLFNLPEYMNQIFRKAVEGSLRIEFKHRGLEELENRLDRSINRLAFALIVAAIVIGSSVLTTARGSDFARLWPWFGIAGYVLATVFGVWLLISIKRSGRL